MNADRGRALAWYRSELHGAPGERPEPPATAADLAEAEAVAEEWGRPLPPSLVELWRVSDGLQANGFSVWGIHRRESPAFNEGFIEANSQLEQLPGMLFIGTCGDEYLTLERGGTVRLVDAVSREPRPMFPDLDTAIVAIIAPDEDA